MTRYYKNTFVQVHKVQDEELLKFGNDPHIKFTLIIYFEVVNDMRPSYDEVIHKPGMYMNNVKL